MLLEIGHIGRPHGLQGEVAVELVTTVADRLAPGRALQYRGGRLVVESARPLPGKAGPHGNRWLVRFEGVPDRESAEKLVGCTLQAEAVAGVEGLWVHELIGCAVVDVAGESHGTVTAVEANPASDLLVLDGGALVPLRFVVGSQPGRVVVEVPEGLFDL
jgi:16S rRNA processing protein RimM